MSTVGYQLHCSSKERSGHPVLSSLLGRGEEHRALQAPREKTLVFPGLRALTLHPLTAHPQHLYPEAQALIYVLYAEQGNILVLSAYSHGQLHDNSVRGVFGDSHLWIKETDSKTV